MAVNGKVYPLWSQFIDRAAEWIGGDLVDLGDDMDRMTGAPGFPMKTMIVNITLEPNGEDSALFKIIGKDFNCGFDVHHGGISGQQESDGWLVFTGYGGHRFKIRATGSRSRDRP